MRAGVVHQPGLRGRPAGARRLQRARRRGQPPPRLRRLRARLPLLAGPLVLALLGAVQLRRDLPLWYDEHYTALVGGLPLGELARLVLDGRGPAAYLPLAPPSYNAPWYALVHLWLALPGVGPEPLALRLPGLACSCAAVGVLAAVAGRLGGPRAALVAGLLAGTAPLVVVHAVEARSYGPALLALALTALGVVRRLQGERGLVLLGVAGAAAGLLHWFALPALAGLGLGAVLSDRRRGLPVLLVLGVAALPALALVALALSHDAAGSPAPPDVGVLLPVLAVKDWAGAVPLALAAAAAALAGLARSPHRLLLGGWLLGGLALVTLAALARPVYYPRYLLPVLVALAVLGALGTGRVLALALVALSLVTAVARLPALPREPVREAVALLERAQRPGEQVVAADARAALGVAYETRRSRLSGQVVLPPADVDPAAPGPVWLVRTGAVGGPLAQSDDEDLLRAAGWRLVQERLLEGTAQSVVVQRWER